MNKPLKYISFTLAVLTSITFLTCITWLALGVTNIINLTNQARALDYEPDEFINLLTTTTIIAAYILILTSLFIAFQFGTMRIALKSIRQHALSSIVTATSVALACGLLMAVFNIKTQTYNAFTGSSGGFDAVLGARGSQLQLVLNSIYHMETSTGNLPWKVFTEIKSDPRIERAIPITVGDNYKGFRIVGTDKSLFTEHQYAEGKNFKVQKGGTFFEHGYAEVVVGSFVADQLNLKLEDKIKTYHGLSYTGEDSAHDNEFLVVGILEPTNTPADRAIWMPYEAYYWMGGHALYGSGKKFVPKPGQSIPDEHKEVSAVLLKFKNTGAGFFLSNTINRQGTVATLAWPIGEIMAKMFEKIGWVNRVLELVAYLVMFVAAGSILASIYNAMNERKREFAILRALGARRFTVFGAIIIESSIIALLGAIIGCIIYFLLFIIAATIIRTQTGVVLDPSAYHPALLLAPAGMIIIGALSGIVPALKAYSTDVATNIIPAS